MTVRELATGREVASFSPCDQFTYFPGQQAPGDHSGRRHRGNLDIPPRRPWYIDYGLPVLFALLVLIGVRMTGGRFVGRWGR